MPTRRTLLGTVGIVAGVTGLGSTVSGHAGSTDDGRLETHASGGEEPVTSTEEAVRYVRNVEEVRGHLDSSVALLERGRREDAELHAGHGSDYFAPVLPPVRNADPELATRLRARIANLPSAVESMDAGAYASHVSEEVDPLLARAVETVVAADVRSAGTFDVRVMNALAGRIAEEYAAAVPSAGTVEKAGEYWDGRGFLGRIEARHGDGPLGSETAEALDRLRSAMEDVAGPSAVLNETLAFRVAATAAAGLPGASVDGRSEAVTYARNVEEAKGHLRSSLELARVDDDAASGLHAGHGTDYVMTVLPPVHRSDATLSNELRTRLTEARRLATSASPGEYERFLNEEVRPRLDRALSTVVGDRGPSFDAAVVVALLDRIEDEYTAAVTDEEVIELYGEYWDARGFLDRVESRVEGMAGALDAETRERVTAELDVLRTELETAATPRDVAGSIEALTEALEPVAEG